MKPALFSGWVTLHLVAFAYLLRFAFVSVGVGGQLDYPSATTAFSEFVRLRSFPISFDLWTFSALFLGVLAATSLLLTFAFRKLLDWCDLHDVYAETTATIVWGIKKYIMSGLIGLALLTPLALLNESSMLVGLAFIAWLAIPFIAINIASPHTTSRWFSGWTNWPDWQTFLATLSIIFSILAFDYFLAEVRFGHWLIEIPVSVGAYAFIHLFATSVLLSIFIYRIPPKNIPHEFKARANWRFVLAWLVLDIKILSLVVWAIPPLLLVACYMIYVVPVTVDIMSSLNQPRGLAFDVFIGVIDAIAQYWWLAAPSFWALWLTISARFLVAYDHLGNRAQKLFA